MNILFYSARAKSFKTSSWSAISFTLFDMGLFLNRQSWGGGGAGWAWCPPIINLLLLCWWSWNLQRYQAWRILHIDVKTKKFVSSLLLRNYEISDARNSQIPLLIWLKFGLWNYLRLIISNIESDVTCKNFKKCRYKETCGTMSSESLEYSLTNWLPW